MKKFFEALLKLFSPRTDVASVTPTIVTKGIDINKVVKEIVKREGGYVNDPDDPGGATNYGVTIGTLKSLKMDLDKDGRVTIADVKLITPALAEQIYLEHYFRKPGIDKLPPSLHATVFDMYVNSGSNAIKILQRMVGVNADGALGPVTYKAVEEYAKGKTAVFVSDAYGIARRNYYYSLADARPASRKYAKRKDGGKGGWIVRAEEFISPSLHLTEAQHRERTRSWK